MKRKSIKYFIPVFIILLGIFQMGIRALAASPVERNQVELKEAVLTGTTGTTSIPVGHNVKIAVKWDATSYGSELKGGDYFVVNIPSPMDFSNLEEPDRMFDLNNEENQTVAKAVVTPNLGKGNGAKVKITFTDWVEDKKNVKGKFHIITRADKAKMPNQDGDNVVQIDLEVENGKTIKSTPITISTKVPKLRTNAPWIEKGSSGIDNYTKSLWTLTINHAKEQHDNVVIIDELKEGKEGTFIDKDSFVLQEVETEESAGALRVVRVIQDNIPIGNRLKLNADLKGFTFNLGNTEGKTYRLTYKSNYNVGLVVSNRASMTSNIFNTPKVTSSGYKKSYSGGSGEGDLTSKIKIIKVDKNDASIKLANAVFTVTNLDTQKTIELKTGANGEVVSPKLSIGKYQIIEKTAPEGYILDSTPIVVEVVGDKPTIKEVANDRNGINIPLEVKKQLVGRELRNQEFSFALINQDNPTDLPIIVENDEQGRVIFDQLRDIKTVGRREFLITEVVGNDKSIKYDSTEIKVVVDVTETQDKRLVANVTYNGKIEIPTFKNVVIQPTEVLVEANKKLAGRDLLNEEFTFILQSKDAPQTVQTSKNKPDGKVEFQLAFDKEGTYNYVLKEKTDVAQPGVTFDKTEVEVQIIVTDQDQDGLLEANVTYNGTQDVPIFNNQYTLSPLQVHLNAKKILKDPKQTGKALQDGEYHFELKDSTGHTLQTKSNVGEKIAFDAIEITKAGQTRYTVSEKVEQAAGITYDTTVYHVLVNAVDKGDGTLDVTTVIDKNNQPVQEMIFTNQYIPGSTSAVVQAQKKLTGTELVSNMFQFELRDEKGNLVEEVSNQADGRVLFKALTYEKPGRYTYSLMEKQTSRPGYGYDTKRYEVVITVSDQGGQLKASVSYNGQAEYPIFNNTYTADPTNWTPIAQKEVVTSSGEKQSMKAGEYQFELKDEKGKVIATAYNQENGEVVFEPIIYHTKGVYRYTLSEVVGHDASITYDSKVYSIVVKVIDNGLGQLKSVVEVEGGNAVVFKNLYTPPIPPIEPNKPDTPSSPNEGQNNQPGQPTPPSKPIRPILPKTGAEVIAIAWLGFISLGVAGVILKRNM